MAGTYADIPGTRFALDQDGTVMKWRNFATLGPWTDVTGSIAEIQKVNTANTIDTTIGSTFQAAQFSFAFPEARTLSGAYIHGGSTQSAITMANLNWEYSTDTNDGTDGTWSATTATFPL